MMIDAIKDLVREEHWISGESSSVLKEEGTKGKPDMTINIKNLPDDRLILRIPENGEAHLGLVSHNEGYRKACDYLMLIPGEKSVDVYLIELKRKFKKDAFEQIFSTIPIWDYLNSMAEIHFNEEPKITTHFVVLANQRAKHMNKQQTKRPTSECTSHKDKDFRVIYSASNVNLEDLKCP